MNRRILKLGAAVGSVLVLALGGAAIARATGAFDDGESHLTGPRRTVPRLPRSSSPGAVTRTRSSGTPSTAARTRLK